MAAAPSHWAQGVSNRIGQILGLLNYPINGEITIMAPPPLDDLDPVRRVSASGYAIIREALSHFGASVGIHRYDRPWTDAHCDTLTRGTIWALLFSQRPERKFLALAGQAWALSPDETSLERALVKLRLRQIKGKLTDYGEHTVGEVLRQVPGAVLRVLWKR